MPSCPGGGLGHATTAIGYLLGNDPMNPRPNTDWIVVHDNVAQTPANVAVPFNFNIWVANTNAVPEPTGMILIGTGLLLALLRPGHVFWV